MSSHWTRLVVGAVVLAAAPSNLEAQTRKSAGEAPLQIVVITLPKGTQDQFFYELREFADRFGFAIGIAPDLPNGQSFFIQMWRTDLKVFGGTNPFVQRQFDLAFYQNGDGTHASGSAEQLAAELKRAVAGIAGAAVTNARYTP